MSAWPTDWVHGDPLTPPGTWERPGIALLFNIECAGCVSRAIPWLQRAASRAGESVVVMGVHTSHGHRALPRDAVAPQVARFAASFARLTFPIALDLDGSFADAYGAEGTPYWLVWDANGTLERSMYGSQANALTRLGYALEGWGVDLES